MADQEKMKPKDSSPNLYSRLEKLREKLIFQKLDAILISSMANRFYLTGWHGDIESGYLLITPKKSFVVTDSRYTEEASVVANYELKESGWDEKFWEKLFSEIKVSKVGFEVKDLSVFALNNFQKLTKNLTFVQTKDFVEELRAKKDTVEISLFKKSLAISDKSFEYILKNIRVGQTEKEIAWKLEQFMREHGAEGNAWHPFIVGAGVNSSKVHYAAGDTKLKKGDQVLIDWGCVYQGYASDTSRVVFLGTPNTKQAEVYNLVLEAQKRGILEVKVGNQTKNVDLAAREFLQEKSEFVFGHGVGHGVGIEVHELPRLNPKAKEKFEAGNVVTVEPGIYEPGWGGVRIEDMILVTEKGYEVLTKAPKKIEEVTLKL